MPRLTTKQYLIDRQWLASLWRESLETYGSGLDPREQWDLHAFYVPADDRSDTEALEHRRRVCALDSSLPQRAGRTIRKLRIHHELLLSVIDNIAAHWAKAREGHVTVSGTVRPQVDPNDMGAVIRKIARDLQRLHK